MQAVQKFRSNVTRYGYLPGSITLKIREPGSAFTHLAGFIFSLAGAGPLIMRASESGSLFTTSSMVIFALSLLILYAGSTLFHWIVAGEKITNIFRKIDHCSISILIAGSYTPVCMTVLRGTCGIHLLAAIWILAAAGILFKLFWYSCPKWFSSILYIGMGWLCITALPDLLHSLPPTAFCWLLAGGIFYTIGGIIYALKPGSLHINFKYFNTHEVFHILVMLGSFCHYILMFFFLA